MSNYQHHLDYFQVFRREKESDGVRFFAQPTEKYIETFGLDFLNNEIYPKWSYGAKKSFAMVCFNYSLKTILFSYFDNYATKYLEHMDSNTNKFPYKNLGKSLLKTVLLHLLENNEIQKDSVIYVNNPNGKYGDHEINDLFKYYKNLGFQLSNIKSEIQTTVETILENTKEYPKLSIVF